MQVSHSTVLVTSWRNTMLSDNTKQTGRTRRVPHSVKLPHSCCVIKEKGTGRSSHISLACHLVCPRMTFMRTKGRGVNQGSEELGQMLQVLLWLKLWGSSCWNHWKKTVLKMPSQLSSEAIYENPQWFIKVAVVWTWKVTFPAVLLKKTGRN